MPQRGTTERFERVYEAYHRQVYVYLRRRSDVETAQECTAETFLVAWRKLDSVPSGDAALPWLYAVARKVMANHVRKAHRFGRLIATLSSSRPPADPGPESLALQQLADEEVHRALAQLRPGDREVLLLAAWEDLPHRDIAAMLGCSTHAVDQRVYRATKRLRTELEQGHEAPDRGWARHPLEKGERQ